MNGPVARAELLPVVYLPGASGNAAVWGPIAGLLAARRPPILVDYPGAGSAAEPDPPLHLSGCSAAARVFHPSGCSAAARSGFEVRSLSDLCRFVATLLPERCDLAALSMGGAVALALCLAHPEKIRKLVLVTTAGGVDVKRFGALDWRESLANRPKAPTWLDDRTDFSDRLGEIVNPTLLVFGDRDPIAPAAVGEFLAARLPLATLEIVAGATHDLDVEQPDLLASLMEAHFRK